MNPYPNWPRIPSTMREMFAYLLASIIGVIGALWGIVWGLLFIVTWHFFEWCRRFQSKPKTEVEKCAMKDFE